MADGLLTRKLYISGMTCAHCQDKIQNELQNSAGIKSVKVSYSGGNALIAYDPEIISLEDIRATIQKLDYEAFTDKPRAPAATRTLGLIFMIAALYLLMEHTGILNLPAPGRLAASNMEYGMLFMLGMLTSTHCLAMCGGINLSQCLPQSAPAGSASPASALRPALFYNLGRVLSYTAIGFIVGALGSAIMFSSAMQGVLKLSASLFMIIMGINMLGIFPLLRKFNLLVPAFFARRINATKTNRKSPLIVGLLNGLLPCGPLQAMQIYALATGSAFMGALSMFLFSLGTVPLVFGLGAFSTLFSNKFTNKVMTVGAVLVVALGLSMFSQGLNLAGFSLPSLAAVTEAADKTPNSPRMALENGMQMIDSTLLSGKYPSITVVAGTPVKWNIEAPKSSINGCNNRMTIKEYGIEHRFQYGANIIQFMPTRPGVFNYSCWMGMIRGTIKVVEEKA